MMGLGLAAQYVEVKCYYRLSVIQMEKQPRDIASKANIRSEDNGDQAVTRRRESDVKTNRNTRKNVRSSSPILRYRWKLPRVIGQPGRQHAGAAAGMYHHRTPVL